MHISKFTTSSDLQHAGKFMRLLLNGDVNNIVCIGNVKAFANTRDQKCSFLAHYDFRYSRPSNFSGVIGYFNTAPLYKATTDGGGAGGVVVRAWRDDVNNATHFACGPHTSYAEAGNADIAAPIYRVRINLGLISKDGGSFDRVQVKDLQKTYGEDGQPTTKQQKTYRLNTNALMIVPTQGLASM